MNEKFDTSKSFAEYFYSFFGFSKARLTSVSVTRNTQKLFFFFLPENQLQLSQLSRMLSMQFFALPPRKN